MVIYNEHIPQDILLSFLSQGRNSVTLTLNSVKIRWGGLCTPPPPPTSTSQKYPPILKLGSPQAAQLITGGKCFAYRDWHETNWNARPGHVVVEM